MCKVCLSIFTSMSWLKVASTTGTSLTRIPSTETTNGEKCFCWLQQASPCLYFLISPHQANNLSIPSGFQSKNLTSMIDSAFISHRPRIDTPPRVSGKLSLWHTSYSGLLHPMCIRGLPCTQWGEKDCLASWMISSHISLWRVMTRPMLGHLSTRNTKNVCMQSSLFLKVRGVNFLTRT